MKTKDLLRPLLAARLTPSQRRQLAAELRSIADEQERIAEAARRQEQRPVAERVRPSTIKAGPGRAPSRFVRVERSEPQGYTRLRLYIGRGLWYDLGSPARLDIQRIGVQIRIAAAEADGGFAVVAGLGMPRMWCDGAKDILDDLDDGRYAAEVRGGAVVIGEKMI